MSIYILKFLHTEWLQFLVRHVANCAHKFENYGFEQYSEVQCSSEIPVVTELYHFTRAVWPLCLNNSKRTCV